MPGFEYILETRRHNKVVAAIMLPPCAYLEDEWMLPTNIQWTLGDRPIREHSEIRGSKFVLRGSSAYTSRLGEDRNGQDLFATGPELFLELVSFIRAYQNAAAKEELDTGEQATTLVFHALDEKEDVEVEIHRFQWVRDVDRERHTFGWDLTLTRVGPAARPELSDLKQAAEDAKEIARSVNELTASVASAAEYLGKINETLDAFREPLRSVMRMTDQLVLMTDEATRIADFPMLLFRDLWHVSNGAANALFGAWSVLGPAARNAARPTYIETMGQISSVRRSTEAVLGRVGFGVGEEPDTLDPQSTTRITEMNTALQVPVVERELGSGDTLATVAADVLGDSSRWTEIASMNGWHSPTEMPNGQPIKPGTVVLVPDTTGGGGQLGAAANRFGTDWLLVDGDLVPAGDEPTDFTTVSGPRCFMQGIVSRLKAVQGVSPGFLEFGLPRLVGEANTLTRLGLATTHVRTQLLLDPRVDDILKAEIVDRGDRYDINAEVVAIDGRRLQLVVPA